LAAGLIHPAHSIAELRRLLLFPQLIMLRPNPQHFRVAFGASLILARHAALVGDSRFAFWADALSAAAHGVFVLPLVH
jgi:hypothetical protein